MAKNNSHSRKASRKITVAELAESRAKRSPQEQVAKLDMLFGKDQGAKKERARLAKQVEEAGTSMTWPRRTWISSRSGTQTASAPKPRSGGRKDG